MRVAWLMQVARLMWVVLLMQVARLMWVALLMWVVQLRRALRRLRLTLAPLFVVTRAEASVSLLPRSGSSAATAIQVWEPARLAEGSRTLPLMPGWTAPEAAPA